MSCLSSSSSSYMFSLLHEDLIIDEILLKLPLDSLLRLRCVCRYFHSLITSPSLLLKLPVSFLLRLRRIPNYFHSLITSPSFIKKHLHLHHHTNSAAQVLLHHDHSLLLFSSHVDVEDGFHHYTCNFSTSVTDDPSRPQVIEMHCPFESAGGIQASCNGLLFLDNRMGLNMDGGTVGGYIWNPCNPKEYKEVPSPPPAAKHDDDDHLFEGIQVCPFRCSSGFCGFGYDYINEEYKLLYYENHVGHLPNDATHLVSIIEFKLYKLGTNTWTSICDNPFRSLFFGQLWKKTASYVNGALHWIMSPSLPSSCCTKHSKINSFNTCCSKNAKIISFDMEKEEFREIQKPHYYSSTSTSTTEDHDDEQCYSRYGVLQVLHGCLCVCEFLPPGCFNTTTDIWMLKDYAVKDSWTKLFTIMVSNDLFAIRNLRVLRLCENGEVVMTTGRHNQMIVYDPVKQISRPIENINKRIQATWIYEVIYTESLVSLSSYIS